MRWGGRRGGATNSVNRLSLIIPSLSAACLCVCAVGALLAAPVSAAPVLPPPVPGERIVLIGNALAERMQYYGHFETALVRRFPEHDLTVRNLAHSGDTPAYRPRAGRSSPWAFPGGDAFQPEYAMHLGSGHYPSFDEWLTLVQADTILAFFGFNESFAGAAGVERFTAELTAFVAHTQQQRYNGRMAPRLVLVSPIAFEDLSATRDLPDGRSENERLQRYTEAMRRAAEQTGVGFVDLYSLTRDWFASASEPLTINGAHLNEAGYRRLAPHLLEALYGAGPAVAEDPVLREAINDKNWYWLNDYRIPNGVHVYGRRYDPFGPENYPQEIAKMRELTRLRDERIWALARKPRRELPPVDESRSRPLDPVPTNYTRPIEFLGADEAVESFTLAEGYQINLFAAESEFPDLRKPVQMAFDDRGRLWVAVMPSYPHYRAGDARPDDKILIFEDTDGDGRADRQTVFARGLHLPTGFHLAPEGVYVSQQPNLVLLRDTDGDDQADEKEYLLHGFDSHDTHHAISAFANDAKGALYLLEGRFLHSQVETPYGCVRSNDGGVYRFDPRTWRLERFSQYDYDNPWGLSFDAWGQPFIADASSGRNYWLLPLSLKLPFGIEYPTETPFTDHRVRPTSGTVFVHSRHFPDDVQGDYLINNTIGFRGTKQHRLTEDGAGFRGHWRGDFLQSSDPNFRPVDLEFGPEGALYLIDWHNPLIGHMQHNARDPNRDHEHGRIYRVTYPTRPLVERPVIAGATVTALLELLTLPEDYTRAHALAELRARPTGEVLPALRRWIEERATSDDEAADRARLMALWVTWGQHTVDPELLEHCLTSPSHHVRAAAVEVLRHEFRKIPEHDRLLKRAAADEHARVRLAALVAASWVGGTTGAEVVIEALRHPLDSWMENVALYAFIPLKEPIAAIVSAEGRPTSELGRLGELLARDPQFSRLPRPSANEVPSSVARRIGSAGVQAWLKGREVYFRDGHCVTCHQPAGEGIAGIYPPLAGSEWVDDEARLLKMVLHGLTGDITVKGQRYLEETTPPMPAFAGLLNDEEIAALVTYVRNAFGAPASVTTPERVRELRAATAGQNTFYRVEALLREHPLPQR